MKASQKLNAVLLSLFLAAGLQACDKAGTAESAGKTIDQKLDEAGNKIEKVSNDVVDAMSEKGDQAGVAIDDTSITTQIKTAFLAEKGMRSLQISVKTVNGVVTLSGSVATQANSDMAKAMAASVKGVRLVKNELVIKKS